jgi:RNA polymerase sigma-70 factor, ECF subfamily
VLAQRRKTQRDRLRFDDAFLKALAEHTERDACNAEEDALALRDCLAKLSNDDRKLIRRRYDMGATVKVIADDLGQSPNAIAVRLHRIRHALLDCVQQLSERGRK